MPRKQANSPGGVSPTPAGAARRGSRSSSSDDFAALLEAPPELPRPALVDNWIEAYGRPKGLSPRSLVHAAAYHLQCRALGDEARH